MLPGMYNPLMNKPTPISATITAENTQASTSSTQTHSSLSLGSAFTGRILIILGSFDGNSGTLSTTGCTVGGNSATKIIEKTQSSGSDGCVASIYAIALDTGTTGDVVFSIGGGAVSRGSRCVVISLKYAQSITATDSGSDGITTGTALSVSSFDILAGGYAVGVFAAHSSAVSVSFSGLTEFADGSFGSESARYGMADDEFAVDDTGNTVTATCGSSPARASFAVASFR